MRSARQRAMHCWTRVERRAMACVMVSLAVWFVPPSRSQTIIAPATMSTEYDSNGTPQPSPSGRAGRGVYWLPNLFTTGTLFGGFYAIVAAINDDFQSAGI